MNWRLDLMQTNLLLFGCFRNVYHLFVLKMALMHSTTGYTQEDLRGFQKHENM